MGKYSFPGLPIRKYLKECLFVFIRSTVMEQILFTEIPQTEVVSPLPIHSCQTPVPPKGYGRRKMVSEVKGSASEKAEVNWH